MSEADYTRPERYCERQTSRRDVARMLREHGACFFCRWRGAEGWERAVCMRSGRTWPLCSADRQEPAFEPDEARLEEFRRANRIDQQAGETA